MHVHEVKLYTVIKDGLALKLVTVSEMAAIERESALQGVSAAELMENAGRAVRKKVIDFTGGACGKKIIVLVGPGNNGGDGLVAARLLALQGARVVLVMPLKSASNEHNLRLATDAGAYLPAGFDNLAEEFADADVCLDAFFGTGRSRLIGGDFATVLEEANNAKRRFPSLLTIAIDLPSGLDGNSGSVDPLAFVADHTLALGYAKTGLYNSDLAIPVTGKITVLDIGIPGAVEKTTGSELASGGKASRVVPRRPLNAHKGTSGRLLVFAGSEMYPGAAFLSSAGAARSGAGLVTLAAPPALQNTVTAMLPEATYLLLEKPESVAACSRNAKKVLTALEEYDALLAGCGLGQAEGTKAMLSAIISQARQAKKPLVLDADALNMIASAPELLKKLPAGCVLTPHPGEMARLCGMDIARIQADRIGTARKMAQEWNHVLVLKGAYTVIASPCGKVVVNPVASPALASAGTGDVLAGVIGGLLVQGLCAFDAAWLGVYLHCRAGLAARDKIGISGVLASDLVGLLPMVLKSLSEEKITEK